MPQNNILVSIAIVTRNRRDLLAKAIRSVLEQTHSPLECVVVDNSSQDDTVEMIERNWPDIKVIRLPRNIGCQPGRNIAMANCRGRYVFNLDDDGVLDFRAIERIVSRFERDPELAVIDCWTPALESAETAVSECETMPEKWMANFHGGASAIRMAILAKTGYFPEFFRGGSEAMLAAYILHGGHEILFLPTAIMYHLPYREKNVQREHAFFMGWHVLKRAFIYLPWPACFFEGIWGFLRGIMPGIRFRCFFAHLKGGIRFIFDVPSVIALRNPVSRDTVKKIRYLNYNLVSEKKNIAKFRDFSWIKMMRQRWRLWRNRKHAGKVPGA